jgi:apolipoprotein D and lipocalin family protein
MNLFSALILCITFFSGACSSMKPYLKTVDYVDIEKFMGTWYVVAGRFTYFEQNAFNPIEIYQWNEKEKRIEISFTFNQNSLDGKLKSIPQKGWIKNSQTNAHWLVSPFWPLKFDYLVIDMAENYSWTVIGVPNQKYLWIMARDLTLSENEILEIINRVKNRGYNTQEIIFPRHN